MALMEMSNALQKNLMQLFPNKIIYSAELCKNISVHMALHREAKRAGVSSRQLTESNGFVWKDIERAMDFSGEEVFLNENLMFRHGNGAKAFSCLEEAKMLWQLCGSYIISKHKANIIPGCVGVVKISSEILEDL